MRLFVLNDTVTTIEQDVRAWRWRETGGPLYGYWTEADELVITRAGIAGPNSRRSPFGFQADRGFEWDDIERTVRDSNGAITYVGDWHSHPMGGCRPSSRDERTAVTIIDTPDARTPEPLVWIAARRLPLVGEIQHCQFLFRGRTPFRVEPHALKSIPAGSA
jgi:integrative and conjugative element protein (TIGR02256 family)